MKKYFLSFVFIFTLVSIGSLLSRHFGWYNDYWFTDIILHTLSGCGFASLWLAFQKNEAKILTILGATSFATLGSVLWEFWEFAGWRLTPAQVPFYIPQLGDTLGDICCGMVGGFVVSLCVVFFVRSKNKTR